MTMTSLLSRRGFISGAAALAFGNAVLPVPAWSSDNPGRAGSVLDEIVAKRAVDPYLEMWNQNTDERLSVRFFDVGGYNFEAIRKINWFMRDWRQAEVKIQDVRLLWALATVRRAAMKEGFNGEIRFLSGYRSRATNELLRSRGVRAAANSFHLSAKANDFSLPGVPVEKVSAYCRFLEIGGVGHYPGSFTHIDSGEKRTWG